MPSSHRFRTSIPRNLWRWATICGWKWQSSIPEHINKLELKAVYTALKWRVARQRLRHSRVLRLVDSMLSLQFFNKGRSSSHKLRRITKKCCTLLVASRLFLVLSYIDTKQNPAETGHLGGLQNETGQAPNSGVSKQARTKKTTAATRNIAAVSHQAQHRMSL